MTWTNVGAMYSTALSEPLYSAHWLIRAGRAVQGTSTTCTIWYLTAAPLIASCQRLARIQAPVIETELVVQSEATRRRWRFLSHLPLGGSFRLAELDLSQLLPPESLAPFAEVCVRV